MSFDLLFLQTKIILYPFSSNSSFEPQLLDETQGLFETLKEYIDTLEQSTDSESQVSGILTLLKSIIDFLEASGNVRLRQSKTLYTIDESIQTINESIQAHVKVLVEQDERITKLNKLVNDIISNLLILAEQIKGISETAAKIPVIDVDNLLKTLNEHADEINENAASIKEIKNNLKL